MEEKSKNPRNMENKMFKKFFSIFSTLLLENHFLHADVELQFLAWNDTFLKIVRVAEGRD